MIPQTDANPLPIGLGLEIYTPEDVYKTVELIGQRSLTSVYRQIPMLRRQF